MPASRNAPCPCGSGRKYKRCCLAKEESAARAARFDDAVGGRIQDWSAEVHREEIDAAFGEFAASERTMRDDELQIFAVWFNNDRELAGGGTPAQRYASRADLPDEEREVAARIAAAQLGLHRVRAVEPGCWIELEDVVGGGRARVRSDNVSREVVRWDLLLGRVMTGDPRSLWGPVRLFAPEDERQLLDQLRHLAGGDGDDSGGEADLEAVFREHALEMMLFRPPRWDVEPSFFTLEGDPLAFGKATWKVLEPAAARERFQAFGGLAPGDPLEIDLDVRRERLLEQDRPSLPQGAVVIETERIGDAERIPVATLRLEEGELCVEAMSEERLEFAIEAVEADFGDIAELVGRELSSIEPGRDQVSSIEPGLEQGDGPVPEEERDAPFPLEPAERERLLSEVMTKHLRRWLDEPLPALDGETPREAAAGEKRGEVIGLVRGIENRAERARRRGDPGADPAWLRAELSIDDELAA